MGFVIGAISQIVHTSKPNHILTWTILLFLNPFSLCMECAVLAPESLAAETIPAVMLTQFAAALLAAILITFLFASSSKQIFGSYIHRPWRVWIMRFAICIIFSLLLYSLLNPTDYRLINKLYFDNFQITLKLPTTEVILAIHFMKSLLIVLSLIPMIVTIGATKRFIAVISGITLVVLSALSPFLQVSNLSMFLLLASSGKIFLQNFLIGILVGLIMGCPSKLEADGISTVQFLRPVLREALKNNADFFKSLFTLGHYKKTEDSEEKATEEEHKTAEKIFFNEPINK
jgi:hypothetical protein